jgi:hypothetical protein
MKGTVMVKSELGNGTSFTVRLPLDEDVDVAKPAPEKAEATQETAL